MEVKNILIISTSHDVLGNTGRQTGMWLESFASPYYLFIEAGVNITLATPAGGELPVDPKSQSIIVATTRTKRFLKDPEALEFLLSSKSLAEINAEDYDAVYITGGHGHLWDIVENKTLKTLLESFYNLHKPIGAASHGVAALLNLQTAEGELMIKGRQLTGFSNQEEASTRLSSEIPFLIETALRAAGVEYTHGDDYSTYVVSDDLIITGQNPASGNEVAKRILAFLKDSPSTPAAPVKDLTIPSFL